MKILVTGGAGFIGSHLVDRLVEEKNEVLVLDNLRRGKLSNIDRHIKTNKVRFLKQDIRNYDGLEKACAGVEVIFHLAAQSNVMGAVQDIDYSFETNLVGTFYMLKAAAKCGVRRLIFSSSREVYGEAQYLPVDEEHPLNAKNPYGASKAAAEKYCRVFANAGGLETVILRLANVYGTRDFDRVIPIFIDRFRRNLNITIFGGKQLIDFIAVDLVVDVFMQAITEQGFTRGAFNVGSGKGTGLFELAQRIKNELAASGSIITAAPRREEVVRFTADISKLKKYYPEPFPDDPLFFLHKMLA